jgi:hypothetical protein
MISGLRHTKNHKGRLRGISSHTKKKTTQFRGVKDLKDHKVERARRLSQVPDEPPKYDRFLDEIKGLNKDLDVDNEDVVQAVWKENFPHLYPDDLPPTASLQAVYNEDVNDLTPTATPKTVSNEDANTSLPLSSKSEAKLKFQQSLQRLKELRKEDLLSSLVETMEAVEKEGGLPDDKNEIRNKPSFLNRLSSLGYVYG